jgi:hypothetical protein
MEDNKRESIDRRKINYSHKEFVGVENVDYVECKICSLRRYKLGIHIKTKHLISIDEYTKTYNSPIICNRSKESYSKANKENGDWYSKAVESGKDMTEYLDKVSNGVKNAIMNSPKERQRRSELMTKINNEILCAPEYRKIMSDSAKKTSLRPEIIAQRQESIVNNFHSAGEEYLKNYIESKYTGFSKGVLKSELFLDNATSTKSVDFLNEEKKIIIEFDGDHHFRVIYGNEKNFEKIQKLDAALNEYVIQNNYMLIRISCDRFDHRKKIIRKAALDEMDNLISSFKVGIYTIGNRYGKN